MNVSPNNVECKVFPVEETSKKNRLLFTFWFMWYVRSKLHKPS